MDAKRWALLLMKGTQPGEVLRSSLLQLDVIAHHTDDIRLLFDDVREITRVSHGKSDSGYFA